MTVSIELAEARTDVPGGEASYSLEGRSPVELQAIVSRGMHGGELYFAAAAELERRARDVDAAECADRAREAAFRRKQIGLLAILASACCAALYARLFGL